jgi:hypothetical protein
MQPIHLESDLGLGQTLSKNNNKIEASTRDIRFVPKVQLSKNNNKIEASTRDIRFVPKVQLTMKVAYVSVEVSTKDRVSLNPKPHRMITKI